MKLVRLVTSALLFLSLSFAQQSNPPRQRTDKKAPNEPTTETTQKPAEPGTPDPSKSEQMRNEQSEKVPNEMAPDRGSRGDSDEHRILRFEMKEVPPVVTHHTINAGGRTLRYTATAGRLPIKDGVGNIEAEMFFVAYTLDGQDASKRPVTFAFNGGPGSASIWLHMGALGPRKVALQNEGWMPAAPYRLMDNPYTPLDTTDLVLVDAIGTGYSRPADLQTAKKFWGLKGDIEGFGEFIRMYLSRYERWSSPLYLLGESYGTTRAAGLAGYLIDKGIAFNGITLLSTIIDFQSVLTARRNDEAFVLTLPTYTMIAAYHKKLPADLEQDFAKTRQLAEQFASGEYAAALAKGDALTPQERQKVLDDLARFTGLKKDFLDNSNLRVDVRGFTSNLLLDEKLKVGRLDGRYKSPDPVATLNTQGFFDPSSAATTPPFTSVFNDYVRRELGYKVDMPYYTSARDAYGEPMRWSWGEEQGYADTATALRAAMIKNPYMKVQVMEGYYDLATPFYAVHYTMDHLDVPASHHKNISYATYEAGHMVYLHMPSLEKMHKDYTGFVNATLPK